MGWWCDCEELYGGALDYSQVGDIRLIDTSTIDFSCWRRADGVIINITDMSNLHLNNTIKMLKRNISECYYQKARTRAIVNKYIDVMASELRRRKEMNKVKNVDLKVTGVSFANKDGRKRQDIIKAMTTESTIMLVREPQNEYDIHAIAVMTIDGQIGYINRDNAAVMSEMMDAGIKFEAKVLEIGEYKKTWYCKIRINQI